MTKNERVNLINSVGGYKSANLIGTISGESVTNLAIFSSVVHIGANPPLLGFVVRPIAAVSRHTYENIGKIPFYTINHVHREFIEAAHRTSARFGADESEFAACGFTEQYVGDFAAPFVKESKIKIGLEFVEEIPIKINDTILIIGEIKHLLLPENLLLENGSVDLSAAGDVCISGLDTYYDAEKIATFPYAKPNKLI